MGHAKTQVAEAPVPPKKEQQDTMRETIESIVVAFVLAFLFRTFIAEAFVIPTGSMAPTLFGRHKDIVCTQCGQHYEVGASVEMNDEGNLLMRRITKASCPNCRFEAKAFDLPVFKGDRILVNKFPYELGHPDRWDVCVFKFPEDPERNYIKRMIGLPEETIRIQRGDVYARQPGAADFQILRKQDPNKQLAIQILVADDAHPPRELLAQGWPERWTGMQPGEDPTAIAGWVPAPEVAVQDAQRRAYKLQGDDWQWLRYRHLVPSDSDWKQVADGGRPNPNPRPQLVTDYYAYNTFDGMEHDRDLFWVGDLTVSGRLVVSSVGGPNAAVQWELVEGIRRYRCEIELATGQATLSHNDDLNPDGPPVVLATAATPVRGPGTYTFQYANVDDRLCLWINGRLIPFGKAAEYQAPPLADPQDGDLLPVGLAVRGATAEFSQLTLLRDIYYRADQLDNGDRDGFSDRISDGESVTQVVAHQLRESLSRPADYAALYNSKAGPIEFAPLQKDEYFVLGDNSPQSQDSRLWTNRRRAVNRHAVPRNAFVGKAFLIYWPHGIPFMNDGHGYPVMSHSLGNPHVKNYPAYTAPFYPQFGRLLKRIR